MNKIKAFFTDKKTKTFAWQTANGFIGLLIVYLSGESLAYAPIVIALLNLTTKWINATYLTNE